MQARNIALLMAGVAAVPFAARSEESSAAARTIRVNGQAISRVAPDEATVTFNIDARNPKVAAARAEHREAMDKVIAALKLHGAQDKDIRLGRVTLDDEWGNSGSGGRSGRIGYRASASIAVKTTDLGGINDLITAAVESGATGIGAVDYSSTNYKTHRDKARELALLAAKDKAAKMAATLGAKIGNARSVEESRTASQSGQSFFSGANNIGFEPAAIPVEDADAFELGSVEYQADVTVEFVLLPGD